jgi:hypothetical protein
VAQEQTGGAVDESQMSAKDRIKARLALKKAQSQGTATTQPDNDNA